MSAAAGRVKLTITARLRAAAATLPIGLSLWWPFELIVRTGGLVLQLLGIGMVAWGIRKTRKDLQHSSSWEQLSHLWRFRPKYGAGVVLTAGTGFATGTGTRAQLSISSNVPRNATVEQHIEALEKNLTRMRDDFSRLRNGTDDEIRRVYKSIAGEEELRARADQDIRRQIKEIEIGGLYISAMVCGCYYGNNPR